MMGRAVGLGAIWLYFIPDQKEKCSNGQISSADINEYLSIVSWSTMLK